MEEGAEARGSAICATRERCGERDTRSKAGAPALWEVQKGVRASG